MEQVTEHCELLRLKNSVLFFLACLTKILANTEHVPIKSMTKPEIETNENTETIIAQLLLFKLPFTYKQLDLIISAKFVFYCVRENKTKKQISVLEFETAGLIEGVSEFPVK